MDSNLTIGDIKKLNDISCKCAEPIYVHSSNDLITVDVKSLLGLLSLDFDETFKIVTSSQKVKEQIDKLNLTDKGVEVMVCR